MIYLYALSLAYCITYLLLFFGIPYFFAYPAPKLRPQCLVSIGLILLWYFAVLGIYFLMQDPEWANRVLHAFGGGFLVVLVTFLATRDSGIKVSAFQFICIAMSAAAVSGIANEIAEFVLQNWFGVISAESINDTWLDLISNTSGSALACLLLAPFIKSRPS